MLHRTIEVVVIEKCIDINHEERMERLRHAPAPDQWSSFDIEGLRSFLTDSSGEHHRCGFQSMGMEIQES